MVTLEERGFRSMLRKRGRDLQWLGPGGAAGGNFRGTINRIGAFVLSTDLGDDPRGKRILEIPAVGAPALKSQDVIKDLNNGEQFRVVNIGLDAPDYSLKFELQQLTAQDG